LQRLPAEGGDGAVRQHPGHPGAGPAPRGDHLGEHQRWWVQHFYLAGKSIKNIRQTTLLLHRGLSLNVHGRDHVSENISEGGGNILLF